MRKGCVTSDIGGIATPPTKQTWSWRLAMYNSFVCVCRTFVQVSFCFSEASAFSKTPSSQKLSTGLQSNSDSYLNSVILAAIIDMLHL